MSTAKATVSDLRKKAHLTQQTAATALGVRTETVSDWEKGKAVPSVLMIPKLSELYKCSYTDVVQAFVTLHQTKETTILKPEMMADYTERQPTSPANLRERVRLSQREVSQALDVRESTVSDWERGVSTPHLPLSKVKKMIEIYQCSLDDLIEAFELKA